MKTKRVSFKISRLSRPWTYFLLTTIYLCIVALSLLVENKFFHGSSIPYKRLFPESSQRIPVSSVSGFHISEVERDNKIQVYFVSDQLAGLGKGLWDGKSIQKVEFIDLGPAMAGWWGICKTSRSQGCIRHIEILNHRWEGISSDGTGRPFLIHRNLGFITIISPDFKKVVGTISLEAYEYEERKPARESYNPEVSGLMLLKNGHILVTRKRDPGALLEYGPVYDEAKGYTPELKIGAGDKFAYQTGKSKVSLLKVWNLPRALRSCKL